jgi:hypothetical protein
MRLRGRDALAVVSTKTGADMGHDPKVTRLYSLRKPAPNVAAFGRAGEGHSLAFSNKTCKAQVREATGENFE